MLSRAGFHPLNRSRTLIPRGAVVVLLLVRLSIWFSISNAVVASWSKSRSGGSAGLVRADPYAECARCETSGYPPLPACGPKKGEVVVDVVYPCRR